MEGKTNPTERPPAREVLARHLAELDGEDPDQTTHQGQPNWERFYAMTADAHLKALAAAGYPVEAGPALVEALEAAEKTLLEDGAPSFVGPDDMRIYQLEGGILSNTLNKIRAALALAETRERLQSRIDDVEQKWGAAERRYYATERELSARIADLQAKLEASRDCSGRYHKRIAKLEAENARLREASVTFEDTVDPDHERNP